MIPATVKTKLSRTRNPRRALLKSLATSLIDRGEMTTTKTKAKAVIPYLEKLITKAKKGGLANRRLIIAQLQSPRSAHKLVDEIAPKLNKRTSGHLRLESVGFRKGDNSPLAKVSFVDELKTPKQKKNFQPQPKIASKALEVKEAQIVAETKTTKTETAAKESVANKEDKNND